VATVLACSAFIEPEELTCDCELEGYLLEDVVDAASDLLVRLTAGRFRGRCTETVRPTYRIDWCEPHACYGCDEIPLKGPNPIVENIWIDGEEISSTEYAIKDGYRLVRMSVDGNRPSDWPRRNKLYLGDDQVGTWSITYTYGHEVDFFAKRATIELACDLMSGLTRQAALDQFVTTATADGMTIQRNLEAAEEQGFSWVARFLRMFGTAQGAEVWSPELAGGWDLHTFS
jgi:hypothetical protein